jgi:hypothetical protein
MLILGRVPAGWWVVLLTLPALAPLARAGFFESHDGLFHVYRLAALDRAVRAGVLYPRWFPEFAFGYGQPVLNFYGSLSYYWGLPFTLLGADAILALKLVFASGLVASALGMYLFSRLHLDRGAAVGAAVVYACLPYHMVDLYVRGALAEFLAFVWFPLVLWAFHRLILDADKRKFPQMALAAAMLAALVLTHNLSALIFAPVLAAYILILLARTRHAHPLGRTFLTLTLTFALALVLTAFYWLPVLAEAQYVGLGHGASSGYQDHLVSPSGLFDWSPAYPYTDEPGVTPAFPLGWVQAAILVAAMILPLRRRPGRWVAVFFLAVALLSTFMLTTPSLPVWKLFERGLAFLQYPWRFLALTVLATAFLAGALWSHVSRFVPYGLLVAFSALFAWSLWHLPSRPIEPDLSVEAMWQMDRDIGQVGTTWTGEYLPIWVTEQRWAISRSTPNPTLDSPTIPANQVKLTDVGYDRYVFAIDAAQDTTLALHQFYYPGWQAGGQVGSLANRSHPKGVLGLATFDLFGSGPVKLRLGLTPAQLWGTVLSLLSALALGIALVIQYRIANAQRSALLLAAAYLLLAVTLIAHLALPNGSVHKVRQVNANLEGTAELLAFTTDRDTYRPGDTVGVTLYWRSLRASDQDYKTFVHLTDSAMTRQPAQHDGDPGGGFSPTTRWLPGELVPDTHHLPLPADLAPGRYRLWAGMYEYEPLRNLTVLSADVPTADNRVLLGEIEVMAR